MTLKRFMLFMALASGKYCDYISNNVYSNIHSELSMGVNDYYVIHGSVQINQPNHIISIVNNRGQIKLIP